MQKYLQFLYLIMEKYAVERSEVVKAIASQYVFSLKALNATGVPRRVFSIQTIFKRPIIQVAETEGFFKLASALNQDLNPRIDNVNHRSISFQSIRNYFFHHDKLFCANF